MVVYWVEKIVEFVTALHQQGFNLGVPIERCLFICIKEMKKTVKIILEKGIPDDKAKK